MHLNLTGMSLSEWAATDMQWWWEAYSAQQAFRQGQQARKGADQQKAAM